MRHLLCHLDDKTKESNEFKGKIGQKLETANFPIFTLLPIEIKLSFFEDKNSLSTHHKYLLVMCVSCEKCSLNLFCKF